MTDINITRHGKWEVRVDSEVITSHNEPKEGYESLIRQMSMHPDKMVALVPNFVITAEISEQPTSFSITEEQIEAHLSEIPLFQESGDYKYVLFEMGDDGLKNFSPTKIITIP